jgi:hypothetical protein
VCFSLSAYAGEFTYRGESEGFYRYDFPDGTGFVTTIAEGETVVPLAAFRFDEGVEWSLLLEGRLITYVSETVLDEPGEYTMIIYTTDGLHSGVMSFRIGEAETLAPSFSDDGGISLTLGEVVENAEMIPGYNAETGRLTYTMPSGFTFSATIPHGAITVGGFAVFLPEGMTATLYRDDILVPDFAPGEMIMETGAYRLLIQQPPRFSPLGDPNVYMIDYRVRVINSASAALDVVTPPLGFTLSGVLLDGKLLPFGTGARRSFPLSVDGEYEFMFNANFAGLTYRLSVERDTEPPLLFFSAQGLTGLSDEPLLFAPAEEDSIVQVLRNGQPVEAVDVITQDGNYTFLATDTAGNTRTYTIQVYVKDRYQFFSPLFWCITVVAGAGLAFWLIRARRMRVL